MALFGKSEEKAAQDEAARAEAERLEGLSAKELAAEMLPAFGPEGARPGHELNILQVTNWLMRDHPGGTRYLKDLNDPAREGLQALENAGLVVRLGGVHGPGARLKATSLGKQALAEGTIAEHLP